MLSQEENDIVTRTGPGTPMGQLMRQYWVPAMLSRELTTDGDPLRVKLLSEELIAFRDSNGQVGLLANSCPHRGASLFFGRNEECGLRCVYHGWKFDVSGACVDMPNEPAESNFKHKVKATSYPCQERGGVVWAYLGDRATPPPLPDLEANMLSAGEEQVVAIQRECNWLQALEGDIDTSHLGFLHMGHVAPENTPPNTFIYYAQRDRAPRYEVVDTDGGTMYGAYRDADPGNSYWRVAQFIFPCYTMAPGGALGVSFHARAWVPLDDDHSMLFIMSPQARLRASVNASRQQPLDTRTPARPAGGPFAVPLKPNSTDWLGRFRQEADARNDYLIDRDAQRKMESYTGIPGGHQQDQAITESMGPIYNRSQEHLGTADAMIIRVRRRLIAAARALQDGAAVPPGVDQPAAYQVRSGGVILPKGVDWIAATKDLRQAFTQHPEVDLSIANG